MSPDELKAVYASYIACLNRRDWTRLGAFVDAQVERNDEPLGLRGYRDMLEADIRAIPDLRFEIRLVIAQPPFIASRLHFDCTPVGTLFGLAVEGRRVRFDENVFYEFAGGKIRRVWSVIDQAAIADQLTR